MQRLHRALVWVLLASCGERAPSCGRLILDGRPPQFEAQYVLKTLLTDRRQAFAEQHQFDTSVESLRFQPEFANRYVYVFSARGAAQDRTQAPDGGTHTILFADTRASSRPDNARILAGVPPEVLASAGVEGTCPACELTIVAAGNLDKDTTIDVWSISTNARTINGDEVPADVPFNHVNDRER